MIYTCINNLYTAIQIHSYSCTYTYKLVQRFVIPDIRRLRVLQCQGCPALNIFARGNERMPDIYIPRFHILKNSSNLRVRHSFLLSFSVKFLSCSKWGFVRIIENSKVKNQMKHGIFFVPVQWKFDNLFCWKLCTIMHNH